MRLPADGRLRNVTPLRRDGTTPRQRYQQRWTALKNERSTWLTHWQELSSYIQPRSTRFLSSEPNKGTKVHQNIINGTATFGLRVLSSGMMAGITSPARNWFRLTLPDPDLAEFGGVKQWLHVVEQRIRQAFARSNIYNHLHQTYVSLGAFGTAALYVEDDPEDVLRAYSFPVGSFALANSARGRADTCYREMSMTVAQLVEMFGQDSVSVQVRQAYERGDYEQWHQVLHIIEPNRDATPGLLGPDGMPWKSCWMEANRGDATSRESDFLREAGYEEFPVLAPRWTVTGEDVYGSSPGMDALGDIKALQQIEKRKAQAVDKIVSPPMRGPPELLGQASLLPGSFTPVSSVQPGQVYAPAMEISPHALPALSQLGAEAAERVNRAFYADLWLMMAQGNDSVKTAREIAERHEEKMLQLGPVMERLQDELLDPLVDRTFGILLRNGDLPPPPEELEGMELRVEYLSIMAQAQKMIGTTAVERLASFVGNLAAVKPEVLDKLDTDQMVDEYGQMLGTPPALVRTDEAVDTIRQARAEEAAAAQASAMQGQAIQGAQVLAQTDMQGDNALNRMLSNLGGPVAPGGAPKA